MGREEVMMREEVDIEEVIMMEGGGCHQRKEVVMEGTS